MKLVLVCKVNGEVRQIHVDNGHSFVRSDDFTAVLRNDSTGAEVSVPLLTPGQYQQLRPGDQAYLTTFSASFTAENPPPVPAGIQLVVIDGDRGQNATIFHSGGMMSTVRSGGKHTAALRGNEGVQVGDNNTMTLSFGPKKS